VADANLDSRKFIAVCGKCRSSIILDAGWIYTELYIASPFFIGNVPVSGKEEDRRAAIFYVLSFVSEINGMRWSDAILWNSCPPFWHTRSLVNSRLTLQPAVVSMRLYATTVPENRVKCHSPNTEPSSLLNNTRSECATYILKNSLLFF